MSDPTIDAGYRLHGFWLFLVPFVAAIGLFRVMLAFGEWWEMHPWRVGIKDAKKRHPHA